MLRKLAIAALAAGFQLASLSAALGDCIVVVDKYENTITKVLRLLRLSGYAEPDDRDAFDASNPVSPEQAEAYAEDVWDDAPRILVIHYSTFEHSTVKRSQNLQHFVAALERLAGDQKVNYVVYSYAFRLGQDGRPLLTESDLIKRGGMFQGVAAERIDTVLTPNRNRFEPNENEAVEAANPSGAGELIDDVGAFIDKGACK